MQKRYSRHEKINCQILSGACIHKHTHKHCPQKGISFLRIHHAKSNADKQITRKHGQGIWKSRFKSGFVCILLFQKITYITACKFVLYCNARRNARKKTKLNFLYIICIEKRRRKCLVIARHISAFIIIILCIHVLL